MANLGGGLFVCFHGSEVSPIEWHPKFKEILGAPPKTPSTGRGAEKATAQTILCHRPCQSREADHIPDSGNKATEPVTGGDRPLADDTPTQADPGGVRE